MKMTHPKGSHLVRLLLKRIVQVELEQEVVLFQSTEHAGKAAGLAVHSAEGRHANLAWLVAVERKKDGHVCG